MAVAAIARHAMARKLGDGPRAVIAGLSAGARDQSGSDDERGDESSPAVSKSNIRRACFVTMSSRDRFGIVCIGGVNLHRPPDRLGLARPMQLRQAPSSARAKSPF